MAFGIDDAIAAGLKVLNKFIPDPEARAKAEAELRGALLSWDQGQMEVNKAEAMHRTLFVAGWRPFVGWTCALAFAWNFIVERLLVAYMAYAGVDFVLPAFDTTALLTILLGMLGLGGLRTYEKYKGLTV